MHSQHQMVVCFFGFFGFTGSSLLRGLFSCSKQALEQGLSSCDTRAYLLCGTCDLPQPGIEHMSPALAGGFFTPEPPRKPQMVGFDGDGRGPAQCRARTVPSRPSMVSEGEGLPCRPQIPAPFPPGAPLGAGAEPASPSHTLNSPPASQGLKAHPSLLCSPSIRARHSSPHQGGT